jgi:hypothetical protein
MRIDFKLAVLIDVSSVQRAYGMNSLPHSISFWYSLYFLVLFFNTASTICINNEYKRLDQRCPKQFTAFVHHQRSQVPYCNAISFCFG